MKATRHVFLCLLLFLFAAMTTVFTARAESSVVFVSDAGSDSADGLTPQTAVKTLAAAQKKLQSGGTVVLCGVLTVSTDAAAVFPDFKGAVITSRYGGVDYAATAGAKLVTSKDLRLSGDLTFEYMYFQADADVFFCGRGHNVTFGDGLTVIRGAKASRLPILLGGDNATANSSVRSLSFYDYTLTVNSGSWYYVKGTNNRSSETHPVGFCGNVTVRINGGEFRATGGADSVSDLYFVSVGGFSCQNGTYTLEINGGTFFSYIYGIGRCGGNSTGLLSTNDGDLIMRINGGRFLSRGIGAVLNTLDTRVNGNFYLSISDEAVLSAVNTISAEGVNGRAYAEVPESKRRLLTSDFDPVLYVNGAAGKDSADGKTAGAPLATIAEAVKRIDGNGVIVLCGPTAAPASPTGFSGDGTIDLTSEWNGQQFDGACLIVNGTAHLDFAVQLYSLALSGSGTLTGAGKNFTIGEGVTVSGTVSLDGGSGASRTLSVASGQFESITGGTSDGTVQILMTGGRVGRLTAASSDGGNASVLLLGGTVGELSAVGNGTVQEAGLLLLGGTVTDRVALSVSGGGAERFTLVSTLADAPIDSAGTAKERVSNLPLEGYEALGSYAFAASFARAREDSGDGKTPLTAFRSVGDAIGSLGTAGGTVVVTGILDCDSETAAACDRLYLTSVFAGFDFRLSAGAELRLTGSLNLNAETVIEKIDFLSCSAAAYLAFNGHPSVIGSEVTCRTWFDRGVTEYISLVGGELLHTTNAGKGLTAPCSLTVCSGSWENVTAGNYRRSGGTGTDRLLKNDVMLTINGGAFYGSVSATGMNRLTAKAELNITGGEFHCGVFGIAKPSPTVTDKLTVNGDVTIRISGGMFCGAIDAVHSPDTTVFNGAYSLEITGGDLRRVSEIRGSEGQKGENSCTLTISESLALDAPVTGTAEYTNPIADFADPMVRFFDGYYYYSYAARYNGKPAIFMTKAANLCDIGAGQPELVWYVSENSGCADMTSLWAPAMVRLDGNVWIYATCVSSGAEGRRIHVWKGNSDSPEDGFTYYGAMQNANEEIFNYNRPSLIEFAGKRYLSFGGIWSKEYKTSTLHRQCIMIAEIDTPYSFSSEIVPIVWPTESWEIEGNVQIVEGPFQINSPGGKLFLPYSAAQTALDDYCVGLLEFTGGEGDSLLDINNWKKHPQPILSKNAEDSILSTAGAMALPSPDGSRTFFVYHAKFHTRTVYTGRRMMVTELTWENEQPVVRQPEALDTVYTLTLNSMPVAERISAFSTGKTDPDPATTTAGTEDSGTATVLTTPAGSDPIVPDTTVPGNSGTDAGTRGVLIGALAAAAAVVAALLFLLFRKKKKAD